MSKLKKFTIVAVLAAVSTAGTLIALMSGIFATGYGAALSLRLIPSTIALSLLKTTNESAGLFITASILFIQFLLFYWLIILLVPRARKKSRLAIITISLVLVLMGGCYGFSVEESIFDTACTAAEMWMELEASEAEAYPHWICPSCGCLKYYFVDDGTAAIVVHCADCNYSNAVS